MSVSLEHIQPARPWMPTRTTVMALAIALGLLASALHAQEPMLIAADNCCVEVRPSEKPHSLPVLAMMLIQHGVYLLENLELEALAAARAYEFAFIVQPLKLKGATGSAVAPMAIR